MIEIQHIDYQYKRKSEKIFKDFSLSIPEGSICGLLGKNGVGKSTLLHLITGMLTPNQGSILVNGDNVQLRQTQTLQDIFLVPEEFELPALNLKEYIKITAPFYPNFSTDLLEACLSDFELTPNLKLNALSMGMKKKVFMCIALASNARLLVMDEPTNGMDIPSKSQFRKIITRSMNEERTLIISTHQVKDVELLLDHVVLMTPNEVVVNESIANLAQRIACKVLPQVPENAIYSQPTLMGQAVMIPNDNNEDTQIDLELLFNAAIANANELKNIIKNA